MPLGGVDTGFPGVPSPVFRLLTSVIFERRGTSEKASFTSFFFRYRTHISAGGKGSCRLLTLRTRPVHCICTVRDSKASERRCAEPQISFGGRRMLRCVVVSLRISRKIHAAIGQKASSAHPSSATSRAYQTAKRGLKIALRHPTPLH